MLFVLPGQGVLACPPDMDCTLVFGPIWTIRLALEGITAVLDVLSAVASVSYTHLTLPTKLEV